MRKDFVFQEVLSRSFRYGCLLLSLLSWLAITFVGLSFLSTRSVSISTNPQTGDPVIYHSHYFAFGPIGRSKPILVPVNDQTKMMTVALIVSSTLGLGFLVFLLYFRQNQRSDAKQPSIEDLNV